MANITSDDGKGALYALIDEEADKLNIPRSLARALFMQESGMNPGAVNPETGATGIGQLMPATASGLGVTDRTDPAQAIPASLKYLREGLDATGNTRDGLHYYYGGPDRAKWGPKTRAYPDQVLRHVPAEDRAPQKAEKADEEPDLFDTLGVDPKAKDDGPDLFDALGVDPNPPQGAAFGFHPQLQRAKPTSGSVTDSLPPGEPVTGSKPLVMPSFANQAPISSSQLAADQIALEAARAKAARAKAARAAAQAEFDAGIPSPDTTGMDPEQAAMAKAASEFAFREAGRMAQAAAVPEPPRPGPTLERLAAIKPQAVARRPDFDIEKARAYDTMPFMERLKAQGRVAMGKKISGLAVLLTSRFGSPESQANAADTWRDFDESGKALGSKGDRVVPESAAAKVIAHGERLAESVAASIAATAPGIGISFIGAPTLGLTIMGLGVMGDEYANGVINGKLDEWDALKRSSMFFAAEVLWEKFGLGSFNKFAKAVLGGKATSNEIADLFIRHLGREGAGEMGTTSTEFAVDKFLPYGMNQKATIVDFLDQLAETAETTIGQTLVMGGAGRVVNAAVKRFEPDSAMGRSLIEQEQREAAQKAADAARKSAMDAWATRGLTQGLKPAAQPAAGPDSPPPAEPAAQPPEEPHPLATPIFTEEQADRAMRNFADQAKQDDDAVKFAPPPPQAVELAKGHREAIKRAVDLTKESGQQHRARLMSGQWVVVNEEAENAPSLEVPDEPGADDAFGERVQPAAAQQEEAPQAPAAATGQPETAKEPVAATIDAPANEAATSPPLKRQRTGHFVSSTKYDVDTEDNGILEVTVHRTPDGGAVVVDGGNLVEHNKEFASGKSDDELLRYDYEPLGFKGATRREGDEKDGPAGGEAKAPALPQLADEGGPEPHTMSLSDFMARQKKVFGEAKDLKAREELSRQHLDFIEAALEEGKEVPEVALRSHGAYGLDKDQYPLFAAKLKAREGVESDSDDEEAPPPAKASKDDEIRAKDAEAKRKKEEAKAEASKKKDAAAEVKRRKQAHREAEREAWTAALQVEANPNQKPEPKADGAFTDFETKRGEVKVFASKENAERFASQRINNVPRGYVPRQVEGGWVLSKPKRERTAAQKANDARLRDMATKVQPDDDLLTMIGKWGGLRASEITADGGDGADLGAINKARRIKPFRKTGGMSLDAAAEFMAEAGFDVYEDGAVDATKARELIDQAISGDAVYTPEGYEMRAQKDAEARAKLESETAKSDLMQSGYNDASEEVKTAVALAMDEAEEALLAAPDEITNSEEISDEELARWAQEEQDRFDGDPDAPFPDGQAEGAQDRPDLGETQEAPRGDELTLAGQTNAEILADEARAKKAAEEKARRDSAPSADGFVLTGSNRPADEARARGQMELVPSDDKPGKPLTPAAVANTRNEQGSDASLARFRPKNMVIFTKPYVGKTGAKLVGYQWVWTAEQIVDKRGEDRTIRVSDWESSVLNPETNRAIVHQFQVERVDGSLDLVSAESAGEILGVSDSTVRTNAKKLLEEEIRKQERAEKAKAELDGIDSMDAQPSPAMAIENGVMTYAEPVRRRALESGKTWGQRDDRYERMRAGETEYSFLVRDGQYIFSPGLNWSHIGEQNTRGWEQKRLRADKIWDKDGNDISGANRMGGEAEARGQMDLASSAPSEYDAALSTFQVASERFRQAQSDYRSMKLSDKEFLAAREEFLAAEKAMDKAEESAKGRKKADAVPTGNASPRVPFNTEDSGAELAYNKRNRIKSGIKWDDIANDDVTLRVSRTTKANVYPRPDYQAMIDGGMQPLVAHLVKQVYDSIAAKPQTRTAPTDDDLQTYIDGVNRVMAGAIEWANDAEAVSAWAGRQARSAGAFLGRNSVNIADLVERNQVKTMLDFVYPDGWKSHREELTRIGGNKVLGAIQPGIDEGKRATKAINEGWPEKQEAWQKQGFRVVSRDAITLRKQSQPGERNPIYILEIDGRTIAYSEDNKTINEWFPQPWVVLDKRRNVKGMADTEEAAIEAARGLVKRDGKTQVSEKGISVEAAEREGPARRMEGEDVSSDKVKETFGFKGVNFGTWMKGDSNIAERQLHLNHAYDAFLDLAEIMGVPPKAMSLNGLLGLAIGAQGEGKYAAHFVPGVNEINLTRTSGAGSLAHEWGHALDHYFARQAGLATQTEPFLTEHATSDMKVGRTIMENGRQKYVREAPEGATIRPEIIEKFKAIVQAMNKKQETPDQAKTRNSVALARSRKNVNDWLKSIKRDFTDKVDSAEFDALAEKILEGDLGDGRVMVGKKDNISPRVDELRSLYKKAHGRVYPVANLAALQSNLDHQAYLLANKDATGSHEPQMVTTDYAAAAAALDKDKGGKRYWSTNLEKFARAFDAFVSDSLAEKAARNSYLAGLNRDERTVPMGEERTAINSALSSLVSEIKTRETDKGVAMFSRGRAVKSGDLATVILDEFGRNDELFRYPISSAKGMVEIMAEVAPEWTVKESEVERPQDGTVRVWKFTKGDRSAVIRQYDSGVIDANFLLVGRGQGGSALYSAVANFAHNNGLKFRGDLFGLSNNGLRRRTEAMLSSALKFGTTKHLLPHPRQLEGDAGIRVPALKWENGNDEKNIRSLMEVSTENVRAWVPEIDDLVYDFKSRSFRSAENGDPVAGDAFDALAQSPGAGEAKAGRTTLERVVFQSTLLRQERGERPQLLGEVLRNARELVASPLQRAYYSRENGPASAGLSVSAARAAAVEAWGEKAVAALERAGLFNLHGDHTGFPANWGARSGDYGAYWRGAAHFNASDHRNPQHFLSTVLHELGEHHGLKAMVGEEIYAKLGQRIRSMHMAGNKAVVAAWKDVAGTVDVKSGRMKVGSEAFLSEVLARVGQAQEVRRTNWWRDLVDRVRAFMLKTWGIQNIDEAGIQTLVRAALARSMRDAVARQEKSAKATAAALEGEPIFHRAYHGTPHDFDRFSTEKIGTGEGAQAYGWGLYFAGKRAVAEHYREALTRDEYSGVKILVKGKEVDISEATFFTAALETIADEMKAGASFNEAKKKSLSDLEYRLEYESDALKLEREKAKTDPKGWDGMVARRLQDIDEVSEAIKGIGSITSEDFSYKNAGSLYEVELAPKEEDYLDWDRPLSEQSEKVKAALTKAMTAEVLDDDGMRLWIQNGGDGARGSAIYRLLSASDKLENDGTGKAASLYLKSIGIPGIRYLDGSSRRAGEGHHNYVIFDEADVSVVAKFSRAQVSTPAFKRWFGDSKVVDERGEPLVVYHGTKADFTEFKRTTSGEFGPAIYLTDSPREAGEYGAGQGGFSGPSVMPVFVTIKNPYTGGVDSFWKEFGRDDGDAAAVARAQEAGYDGVIATRPDSYYDNATREFVDRGDVLTHYIAFSPEQIKSAIGNNGDFDPQNPDIRFSRGPGWYSALERAVEGMTLNAAPAKQWSQAIANLTAKGVKKDEIEWSGVQDWLALQDGKVTKEAVLSFISQNGVKVGETVLGAGGDSGLKSDSLKVDLDAAGYDIVDIEGMSEGGDFESFDVFGLHHRSSGVVYSDSQDAQGWANTFGRVKEVKPVSELPSNIKEMFNDYGYSIEAEQDPYERRNSDDTRYSQYTLPGGENYREVLLTLPEKEAPQPKITKRRDGLFNVILPDGRRFDGRTRGMADDLARGFMSTSGPTGADKVNFHSQHFNEPNIVAHLRVKDRDDAQGRRILFVEEIQSDWAQKGKREGFNSGQQPEKWLVKRPGDRVDSEHDTEQEATSAMNALARAYGETVEALGLRVERGVDRNRQRPGVPPAPFVTKTEAWVSLAVKRAIRMAVDEGYDGIAWTTGTQQEKRYWGSELVAPAVRRWNEISKPQSVREELLHHFGRELAAVTPLEIVDAAMLPALKNDQVLRAVVQAIPVDVVNILAENGVDPNKLLRQPDVNGNGLPINVRPTVARGLASALQLVGTRLRAALYGVLSADATGGDKEVLAAVRASDLEARIVMGLLSSVGPADLRANVGAFPIGNSRTSNRAEVSPPLAGVDLTRKPPKLTTTELAEALNSHAAIVANRTGKSIADLAVQPPPGEGMRAFYDKIVPGVVRDVLKKLGGGKVETLELDGTLKRDGTTYLGNYTQPGFYLSPEMREKASGPMPMFSRKAVKPEKRAKVDSIESNSSADRVAKLADGRRSITEVIADHLNSDKSLNFWHKTVGTPFHLAHAKRADGSLANPDFKRVYDAGQEYLREMASAAITSADLAPSILPKMEGLKGAVKSVFGAASQKDIAAASRAIFDGTADNPHKGVVFSDAELVERFKLTPRQITLYREARASIDHSLDLMLAGEVARKVRNMDIPADVMRMVRRNPAMAGYIVGDELAGRARDLDQERDEIIAAGGDPIKAAELATRIRALMDLATDLGEAQDTVESLKAHGYAPLQRFGNHTVSAYDMSDPDKPVILYYSMHESQAEANAAKRTAKQFLEEKYPDTPIVVESGIKKEKGAMLYRGLTPDSLDIFARTLGLGQDPVYQTMLKAAVNSRSALMRMVHRKGVSGYEEDLPRVLASFITSNARRVATNWHMGELVEAAEKIRRGDVADYAIELVDFLQNPKEAASWLRSYLFINYLGGSIASAAVNMTQPLTMTFPYLSQWGAKRAVAELTHAMSESLPGVEPADRDLRAAIKRGEDDGIVAPQEVHMLHAEAMRNMGSNLWVRRGITAWGALFSVAEAFNRRVTFIAAYRVGKAEGVKDVYAFARKAVEETQGVYNRGNRPAWARSAIGATLFTFKQYSVSYLEFLKRLPPQGRALALLVIFLLAGTRGLPFAEDAMDVLDAIAQKLGYSFNSREALRKFVTGMLGQAVGNAALVGVSHFTPLDVQGRLGMGNLIPGTAALKQSTEGWREAVEVLGPAGSLGQAVIEALRSPNTWEASKKAWPVALQNIDKGMDMWNSGMYKDSRGNKVKDVTKGEALLKAGGFQPASVAAESRLVSEQLQDIGLHKKRESAIVQDWAQGLVERRLATTQAQTAAADEKVDRARKDLADWNAKNPDKRIVIKPEQVRDRAKEMLRDRNQRIIKRAPPELRKSVRDGLED